jgi:lipopolysaccharide/colanic/teichoic acid biosynthesis glycosyltransferase
MSGSEDEILVRNSLIDNNFGLYIDKVIDVVNTQDSELNKNSLQDYIKKNDIKVIVANTRNEKISKLLPHVYRLNVTGVRLYDIYVMYEYLYKKIPSAVVNYHWFYENVDSEKKIYDFLKRVIDLILCVPVLVVLLILHPWVVRNIKKDDDGEIYSIQERLGLYGKKIYIKKYRTMSFTDKGAWLEQSVNKVTRFGAFLRKTRIDELPQVYAVLKGDLTFIGPRTDIVNLGEKLTIDIPFYNIRYSVKPGLSGWAQTNMSYQPRTVEDTIERLKYDLYYVKNRSIVLDLIVLLKTIKTVLSREGS